MKLVEKHILRKSHRIFKEIDNLSFLSKNLYNAGLYIVRQHFFTSSKFFNYEKLQKHLQISKQADYYALPTKVSQQILKTLCKNFESFFRALEEYKKNPSKFKARPKLPKYKHKTKGRNIVVYPSDAINARLLKKGEVKLSMSDIKIPCDKQHIKQVRLVPRFGMYKLEIVYESSPCLFQSQDISKSLILQLQKKTPVSQHLVAKFSKSLQTQITDYNGLKPLTEKLQKTIADKLNSLLKTKIYNVDIFKSVSISRATKQLLKQKPKDEKLLQFNRLLLEDCYRKHIKKHQPVGLTLDKQNIAGIDIGLDNLAAIASNQTTLDPLLINGRPLKSINQYFNKKRSKLMSFIRSKGTSKRIENLTHKRNCLIDNYLHQSSRKIVDLLVKHNIGTLVIGKNDSWKQQINIGKKNNQNFVSIPHAHFIRQLQYKCQMAGIDVVLTEESYTSKCSFLDNEPIKKHQKYLGKRIKRGLFRSRNKTVINADINGAANIIRKVIPNAFANGIERVVVFPKRIHPLKVKINQM